MNLQNFSARDAFETRGSWNKKHLGNVIRWVALKNDSVKGHQRLIPTAVKAGSLATWFTGKNKAEKHVRSWEGNEAKAKQTQQRRCLFLLQLRPCFGVFFFFLMDHLHRTYLTSVVDAKCQLFYEHITLRLGSVSGLDFNYHFFRIHKPAIE